MGRADELRQRIADYRRQLAEGLNGERAVEFLHEIKRLQAELAQVASDDDKRG